MATLSKEHRKLLENTVAAARAIAVAGAGKALLALRVGEKETPTDPHQKELRSQLRAHGRQLGDRRQPGGTQETLRLEQACAYEHWHRLLFARFLAENDLLVNPEFDVPMSLAEIQETAREQKCDWLNLASEYAQRMLLEVFRPDDPVLRVALPPETRQQLEEKLALLPQEIFRAEDSLGWVYQHWQRDQKQQVNESEVKVGSDELAPVTQLFTEDYMVLFLLHNTLGAWWAARRRSESKPISLSGYDWTNLRLDGEGHPSAGNFSEWPKSARELRILDPCMGSGHFLAFALPILAQMRQEEESLSLEDAVRLTLAENLFGLELDARCSQIAAFNLALTAWRLVGRPIALPSLNLACTGLGINASLEAWTSLAGDNKLVRDTLDELYSIFRLAPTLGSLIDPARVGKPLLVAKFTEVWPLLERALSLEQPNEDTRQLAIQAKGVATAARLLSQRFTLVTTNVPYLGRSRQSEPLKQFCDQAYGDAASDIASCFVERCLTFCSLGGSIAIVTKQELLFQGSDRGANKWSYKTQRQRLLRATKWVYSAALGPRAFRSLTGERVMVVLLALTAARPTADSEMFCMDVGSAKTPEEKARQLINEKGHHVSQHLQLQNPDSRIMCSSSSSPLQLGTVVTSYQGIKTGDDPRFRRFFWELPQLGERWRPFQSTVKSTRPFGGRESVIDWRHDGQDMARLQGLKALGRTGIAVSQSRGLPCTTYTGELFDSNVAPIVPNDERDLAALWAFCASPSFGNEMAKIDPKFAIANSSVTKVPFNRDEWAEEASHRGGYTTYGRITDPTQWLFDGSPYNSEFVLQVAVARLVGYRWPRQTGSSFPGFHSIGPDGFEKHSAKDGIVCINALGGEPTAADRLRAILAEVYGADWSAEKVAILAGSNISLDDWLRNRFFAEHCQRFENRPFVWHIWDGLKDGFHALVNYHLLAGPGGEGQQTLNKLTYTYLGLWIRNQEQEVREGKDGAELRLSAARHLQVELASIMKGEARYDLFIRWKPLSEQPMGWEPDLNDGVLLNLRPWIVAKPYKKQDGECCILRVVPVGVPFGKSKGKESVQDVEEFPWYAASQDRTNDEHPTLERRRVARERKKKA